eukprot:m.448765 g.448765  ORF g.448765 m.448765 type:complete len:50 (+) comp20315_c14_seq49:462-611(+)
MAGISQQTIDNSAWPVLCLGWTSQPASSRQALLTPGQCYTTPSSLIHYC